MKEVLSDHRIALVASVSAMLLGWATFASPDGSSPRTLALAGLATILVTVTTVLLNGLRRRIPAVVQPITLAFLAHTSRSMPQVSRRRIHGQADHVR